MTDTLDDQLADDRALIIFLLNRLGEDAALTDPGSQAADTVRLHRYWLDLFERCSLGPSLWDDRSPLGIRLQEQYTTVRFLLWGVAQLYADSPGYRSHWWTVQPETAAEPWTPPPGV